MKKITALILFAALLLSLAGCGKKAVPGNNGSQPGLTEKETVSAEVTTEAGKSDEEQINELKESLAAYTADEIAGSVFDDFDGDGDIEGFALAGKADGDIFYGSLLFAGNDGCETVVEDFSSYYSPDSNSLTEMTVNGRDFAALSGGMGAHSVFFALYSVFDGRPGRRVVCGDGAKGEFEEGEIAVEDDRSVRLAAQSYTGLTEKDETDEGLGLTIQNYYFYWDEDSSSFREFGATEITEKELSQVKGTGTALDIIDKNGYEIRNILFRGNGLAIINLYRLSDGKAENGSMTLKYDSASGSFTFTDENEWTRADDGFYTSGITQKAISRDAEYPKFFLDIKEW